MDNNTRIILENQLVIMHALNILITPTCRGSMNDNNGETMCNLSLLSHMKVTERILQNDYE